MDLHSYFFIREEKILIYSKIIEKLIWRFHAARGAWNCVRLSGFNLIVIDLQKITWREAPKFFRIVECEIKILIRKFDVKSCKIHKNPKQISVFQEILGWHVCPSKMVLNLLLRVWIPTVSPNCFGGEKKNVENSTYMICTQNFIHDRMTDYHLKIQELNVLSLLMFELNILPY